MRPLTFEQAKARFVHRFTMEHFPMWALQPRNDGSFYAPHFATDLEWYNATLFPGEGHIGKRSRYCETSNQTWPLGKSLLIPFTAINRHLTRADIARHVRG